MPSFETGRLLWAIIADPSGFAKPDPRPAMILRPSPDGKSAVVVVGSTKVSSPLADDQVMLPWDHQGTGRSKLRRPTVAICSWIATLELSEATFGGIVHPDCIELIIAKVKQFNPSLTDL